MVTRPTRAQRRQLRRALLTDEAVVGLVENNRKTTQLGRLAGCVILLASSVATVVALAAILRWVP